MPSILTRAHLDKLLTFVSAAEVIIFDTETTGLKPWEGDRLIGIGIGLEDKYEFYLPFRHTEGPNLPIEWLAEVIEALQNVPTLVAHNIKFDLAIMAQDGYVAPPGQRFEDTMSAGRLCEPDRYAKLDLESLLEKHLGPAAAYKAEFDAAMRALKLTPPKKRMAESPVELCGKYCEDDVRGTRQLRLVLQRILKATEQWSLWQQEIDVIHALWNMESVGLGFNREFGEYIVPVLQTKISLIKDEIYELAGTEFNPNSPPQLSKVMSNLGLKSPKKGKNGPSWDKTVLESLEFMHPLPAKLLELRSVQKVEGTDIRPRLDRGLDVIHEEVKSFGAITGRMSSGLHTFPREGIVVNDEVVSPRNLVVPREDFELWFVDYSQMEMRVFADYMGDPDLLAKIEMGDLDYHDLVAKEVWGVDESHPDWKEFRRKAKAINFGIIYGIGEKLLAANLGVSVKEAREFKQEYFNRMPRAEPFVRMVGKIAETRGYVRNRFNRRYWIDPHRIYVAVNYLVQGTSADIMKNRIVAIQEYIWANNLRSRMLLQVHDEIIFEVHESERHFFMKKMKDMLEERLIKVFLAADVSIGDPGWGSKIDMAWCEDRSDFHVKSEHRKECIVAA